MSAQRLPEPSGFTRPRTQPRSRRQFRDVVTAIAVIACFCSIRAADIARAQERVMALEPVFQGNDLIILGDVKHGVRDRIAFFSSEPLFASLAQTNVRHVAIEMPRILGRQAMGIETEQDVELFAQDVLRSGRWHFADPEHPLEDSEFTQHLVASALGRQVLFAKRYGINPIFYDFNNPLGGFKTHNDPVYRCLANLEELALVRYSLDGKIGKDDRDAAIMRERFSHDGELAGYILKDAENAGGGKLVVIPGYAHAILADGLAQKLETRLNTKAAIVAVFADQSEEIAFDGFLADQARMLQVDLSRPAHYAFRISDGTLQANDLSVSRTALNRQADMRIPPVCQQWASALSQ